MATLIAPWANTPISVQAEAQRRRKHRTLHVPDWREVARGRIREIQEHQRPFIDSTAKRKVVRGGRRGGKTVGAGIVAANGFLDGHRILYAVPTQDQLDRFWHEVKRVFEDAIARHRLYKNETRHIIEIPGTETRIRAKTAWNADTLRGDYADLLILDEFQLMAEDAWETVGQPMLLDNNGDAIFIYTPPSIRSTSVSKAKDKKHATKLYKKAQDDPSGLWATFHFSSHDNPMISKEALEILTKDMSARAYKQEILAEEEDDNPNALWNRELIVYKMLA